MLAIFQAAGWPIWLLLIASIVAVALIVERLIFLRREKILPKQLLEDVIRVYRSGKVTPDVVNTLEQNSPLGAVLASALRNVDAPRDVMKESIEEAGRGVAHGLERFLTTLGTIASLAPLMGLFGTVVGMIQLVLGILDFGIGDASQLAGGIGKALVCTATGMIVAIPALMFHRYFRGRIAGYIVDMEHEATRLMDVLEDTRR